MLLVEQKYGRHSNLELLLQLERNPQKFPDLEIVAILQGSHQTFMDYSEILDEHSTQVTNDQFAEVKESVHAHDVCNLQYTSGSTGDPKAAMLTHL
jgi:long-subunit acyl-CoA synthetase (AMP-forming)